MIRFGANPIAWANDDDQTVGAHIATETILDEAGRQIGFDGIENGHRWPEDPEALRALLARYGLVYISGWYSMNLLVQSVEDEIKGMKPVASWTTSLLSAMFGPSGYSSWPIE